MLHVLVAPALVLLALPAFLLEPVGHVFPCPELGAVMDQIISHLRYVDGGP